MDDWVAYIVQGTRSKGLILADRASERNVKTLLARLPNLARKDIEKLARAAISGAFAKEALAIHQHGHLSDQLIARATGAAPSTVRGWLALRGEPTGVRAERIAELAAVVERLARVIKPEYVPVWLTKPLAALDDGKPIDLLGRGEYIRVARLISGLEDSGAA